MWTRWGWGIWAVFWDFVRFGTWCMGPSPSWWCRGSWKTVTQLRTTRKTRHFWATRILEWKAAVDRRLNWFKVVLSYLRRLKRVRSPLLSCASNFRPWSIDSSHQRLWRARRLCNHTSRITPGLSQLWTCRVRSRHHRSLVSPSRSGTWAHFKETRDCIEITFSWWPGEFQWHLLDRRQAFPVTVQRHFNNRLR